MTRLLKTEYLSAALFFVAVFLFLLRPVGAEQDFWWHLSTGRWIWGNMALPDVDPFALFPSPRPDSHDLLILKGYWLSQVLYFLIHQAGGLTAICILGALTMTTTILVVWLILRKHTTDNVSIIALAPLVAALGFFSEHRPQQFTFLFFALLLFLLERIVSNLVLKGRPGFAAYVVPLLITIWAQLHPGYVVALPLILIYLTTGFVNKVNPFNTNTKLTMFLCGLACIMAALTAPAGIASLLGTASSLSTVISRMPGDVAQFTPLDYARPWDVSPVFGPWYWRLLLAFLGAALFSCCALLKELPIRLMITVTLFAVLSLCLFRFGIFGFITGTVVLGFSLHKVIGKLQPQLASITSSLIPLCLALAFLISGARSGAIAQGTFTPSLVSDQAIRFLLASNIPGGVANPYSWGGYLIWRAWPHYRIFSDQRGLGGVNGRERYNDVMFMEETSALDRLQVNAVVINHVDPVTASVYYGFITLMESGTWNLVYYDDISALFARSDLPLPAIKKSDLERDMTASLMSWRERAPEDVVPALLLGQIRFWRGDFDEAGRCFNAAAASDPKDERPRKWLEALRNVETARNSKN